jgi:hypothetical protein
VRLIGLITGLAIDLTLYLIRILLGWVLGLIVNQFIRPFGLDMAALGVVVAFVSCFLHGPQTEEF